MIYINIWYNLQLNLLSINNYFVSNQKLSPTHDHTSGADGDAELAPCNSGSPLIVFDRQTGQLALDRSHTSTHSWWNKCLQWSNVTISPSWIELRQIEHSSPLFLIDSFFFVYSNAGNRAISDAERPAWWSSTALTKRLRRLRNRNHTQRNNINSRIKRPQIRW